MPIHVKDPNQRIIVSSIGRPPRPEHGRDREAFTPRPSSFASQTLHCTSPLSVAPCCHPHLVIFPICQSPGFPPSPILSGKGGLYSHHRCRAHAQFYIKSHAHSWFLDIWYGPLLGLAGLSAQTRSGGATEVATEHWLQERAEDEVGAPIITVRSRNGRVKLEGSRTYLKVGMASHKRKTNLKV